MEYIDYIFSGLCVLFCFLHFIISLILSSKRGKQISKLCEKCHLPIFEDTPHLCPSDILSDCLSSGNINTSSEDGSFLLRLSSAAYSALLEAADLLKERYYGPSK